MAAAASTRGRRGRERLLERLDDGMVNQDGREGGQRGQCSGVVVASCEMPESRSRQPAGRRRRRAASQVLDTTTFGGHLGSKVQSSRVVVRMLRGELGAR